MSDEDWAVQADRSEGDRMVQEDRSEGDRMVQEEDGDIRSESSLS